MIFVLISERGGSVETLRNYARDQIAREQFGKLDGNGGSPTLN
jgi:hypothetical protein